MTRGGSTPTRGPAPSFAPVQSDSGGAGPAIDGWPGTEGPYTAAFDDPESFRVVPQTSEGKFNQPHPTRPTGGSLPLVRKILFPTTAESRNRLTTRSACVSV